MQSGQFRTSCRSRVIHQFWKQFVFYVANAGLVKFIFKSSIRAKWRKIAPRNWCGSTPKKHKQKSKRGDSRDADDRLRDLPVRLEEFTDNLQDTEPAYISQDSVSERPTNVGSKSRKQSNFSHFPKDRDFDVCLRTKITRAPCRKRTGRSSTSCGKVWWLDNGWSQGSSGGGWITELFKILPLKGSNPVRAEQRLHKRRKSLC